MFTAQLDERRQLTFLGVADGRGDGFCGRHDLRAERPSRAVAPRHELLRDDDLQIRRKPFAHLRLLHRVERADEAGDRFRRAGRVQGREREVSCLGERERGVHGRAVAHFAQQNDVGVLAQYRPQGVVEAFRVVPHLALRDEALRGDVQVFHRIFDGEEMLLARLVDAVEDAGERRGLAAARRARHEDESLLHRADFLEKRNRQPEFLEGEEPVRQKADGPGDAVELEVHVDADASVADRRVRAVKFSGRSERREAVASDQPFREICEGVALERGRGTKPTKVTMDAQTRLLALAPVQVRGVLEYHPLEKRV